MIKFFKNLYNETDFFFRKNIRLKRKYTGKNEPKENLFSDFSDEKKEVAEEKEKIYLEKYHLQGFKDNSTCRNYLENLAVIELLESCFNKEFLSPTPLPPPSREGELSLERGEAPITGINKLSFSATNESVRICCDNPIKILDIGSKNWFYSSGEWSFFKYSSICHPELVSGSEIPKQVRNDDKDRTERDIFLDGIEIDAFRVYSDFHTRWDYAHFYIKNLSNTRYIAKDFMKHNEKYDYIIWFFPFVTEFPLQEWGLPLSKFKPAEMLKHAYESLNYGGKMLIVNQDEKEYAIQEDLLKDLNLHYEKKGDFKNSFLEYEHKRFVTVIFDI